MKLTHLPRLLRDPSRQARYASQLLERREGGHHGQSPALTETDEDDTRRRSAGAHFGRYEGFNGGYRCGGSGFIIAIARREVRDVEPARSPLTLIICDGCCTPTKKAVRQLQYVIAKRHTLGVRSTSPLAVGLRPSAR